MLTNKELGLYLRKIRENCALSLRQVGNQSSISYSHLSMIENGTRKPTALILKQLAKVYNLDYIDLYEKAGYIDLSKNDKSTPTTSSLTSSYSYINTEGLSKEDIEDVLNFIEFIKNKKKKDDGKKL